MKNKSEKYIAKQKDKYAKLKNSEEDNGNKKSSMLPAFYLANKKGDLDILQDFIVEKEAEEEFEDQAVNSPSTLDKEIRSELIDFSGEIGIIGLQRKFGEELGSKVEQLYQSGRLKRAEIHDLLKNINGNEMQAPIISELLDLFTDPNLVAGIHMTGSRDFTESIFTEGLKLTGHLSSGSSNIINDIESMSQNTILTGNATSRILPASDGGYRGQMSYYDEVDIAIIAIPKDDINFRADVFIDDGLGRTALNPRYIYGAVTTDKEKKLMLGMTRNEKFLDYDSPSLGQRSDYQNQGQARSFDYDYDYGDR